MINDVSSIYESRDHFGAMQNVAGGSENYLQRAQAAASSPVPAGTQLHALFDYARRPL